MRLRAHPAPCLRGRARVPGDKSISHRSLMLAALAVGESRISGLLEGEDVLATAAALARARASSSSVWATAAGGSRAAASAASPSPIDVLDLGNAGTGARLLLGLLAGHAFTSFLTGDASLRSRPMGRVIEPLTPDGRGLPRAQPRAPAARDHRPGRSACRSATSSRSPRRRSSRRSCWPGCTRRAGPPWSSRCRRATIPSACSAAWAPSSRSRRCGGGGRAVTIIGQPELEARGVRGPGRPVLGGLSHWSRRRSAPGSAVGLDGVGVNPLRTGLLDCLREMGADLRPGRASMAGRRAGRRDLVIAGRPLTGVDVPAGRAPRMIDEYPILAVAAACAQGPTSHARAWPSSGSRRATGWPPSRAGSPPAASRSRSSERRPDRARRRRAAAGRRRRSTPTSTTGSR